jgi:Holliday junction resolvase RusA-like endonuclease
MKTKPLIFFTIPGEPKGKARPVVTRTGHAFTPKGTVLYENWVKQCATKELPENYVPSDKPIAVLILACFGIPKSMSKKGRLNALTDKIQPMKKPDTDNIAKIILDSLNQIVYQDDKQVASLQINKKYAAVPQVIVNIYEMMPEDKEEGNEDSEEIQENAEE